MQQNINGYNQAEFESYFKTTDTYSKLAQDFDILSFDYHFKSLRLFYTPRQMEADRNLPTKLSVVPFYYLKFLTDRNPEVIYDMGCGWNIFKKYIPNVVGISAEPPDSQFFFADIYDYVDDDYIANHQNYFESIFAINSLHFRSLSHVKSLVLDFASMIKDGGAGYMSLNCIKLLDLEKIYEFDKAEVEYKIRQELYNLPIHYEVFDMDLTEVHSPHDGNIRIVITK